MESHVVKNATAGLFGTVCGATIKNLTLKNVTVKSSHYAGAIVGYSSTGHKNTIEGCTVDGDTITSTAELIGNEYDNGDKAGGIMGFLNFGYARNNTVKNTTITAYRDLGGIISCAGVSAHGTTTQADKSQISGNKIENVTLVVDKTHNYKEYTSRDQHNVANHVGRNEMLSDGTKSTIVSNNTGEATIKY